MTDSGALLSTCAGAGATLVAIVGGLLVSRYLTLESEALGARKLVGSLEEKLNDARARAGESQRSHELFELREALIQDEHLESFIRAVPSGGLSVEALSADLGRADLSSEVLKEVVAQFNTEAGRVAGFNWDLVPHAESHDYWSEFARQHGVRTEIEEMWEHVYIEICKERPTMYEVGNLSFPNPMTDMATMGTVSVPDQNRRRDIRNRLIESRDLDRAEVRRLKAEFSAAVTARESLEQPPGLAVGLVVLAFLTIASVIVPVLLLAPTPATLTYRESVLVVGLFIIGIVVLFAYLGSHVYRLLRLSRAADAATSS